MKLLNFITLSLTLTLIAGTARSQTCESLFNISVISKFSIEDQTILNTLARRQVELTSNFAISKIQKDTVLKHIDEQLESFIADNKLELIEETTFRQEYRALVFQHNRELFGTTEEQVKITTTKQEALQDREHELNQKKQQVQQLLVKYKVSNINSLLIRLARGPEDNLLNTKPTTPEEFLDFKLALELVSDIDRIRDSDGIPILQIPLYNERYEFVEHLIENGANVNIKSNAGMDTLSIAVEAGQLEILKLLIAKGADVNAHNSFEKPLIHKTIVLSNTNFLDILLLVPNLNINATDSSGVTALQTALRRFNKDQNESISIVKKLLKIKNIDVNLGNLNEGLPFETAMKLKSYTSAVDIISHPSFDIRKRTKTGQTALHLAVKNREIAKMIIDKGVDIDAQDKFGHTALHHALLIDNTEVVDIRNIEFLIANGANVNIPSNLGNAPIHTAYMQSPIQQYEIIKLLLKNNTLDLTLKDNRGFTYESLLLNIRKHIEPEFTEYYKSRGQVP